MEPVVEGQSVKICSSLTFFPPALLLAMISLPLVGQITHTHTHTHAHTHTRTHTHTLIDPFSGQDPFSSDPFASTSAGNATSSATAAGGASAKSSSAVSKHRI